MTEDYKSQVLAAALAQALADMRSHDYVRIDMPWEQRAFTGDAVVDHGMIYLTRNDDGSITARITDMYTEGSSGVEQRLCSPGS